MSQETIYTGVKSENWDGAASESFRHLWERRARLAAAFVPTGSRVLDLGCGEGLIRDRLPTGCTWRGYDLRPLSPEVTAIDLDAGQFPDGKFDVVLLLGVLGWLKRPADVLRRARVAAPLIVSNDAARRSRIRGLLHLPTQTKFAPMLRETGIECKERLMWNNDAKRDYFVSLWS